MVEMEIDITPDMQQLIEQRLSTGRYIDAGEYLCDLIRKDMDALEMIEASTDRKELWPCK